MSHSLTPTRYSEEHPLPLVELALPIAQSLGIDLTVGPSSIQWLGWDEEEVSVVVVYVGSDGWSVSVDFHSEFEYGRGFILPTEEAAIRWLTYFMERYQTQS